MIVLMIKIIKAELQYVENEKIRSIIIEHITEPKIDKENTALLVFPRDFESNFSAFLTF